MTAEERWPKAKPRWLVEVKKWVERTGIDPGDVAEHEMPCIDCDGIIDQRDLSQVAAHMDHRPVAIEPGKYLGKRVGGSS